jgi:general L-amino acid transport system permease protein
MIHRPSRAAEIGQWVFLLAVLAFGALLASMLADNLARRNLSFGFGFLGARAGFDIPFHLISWSTFDTYARALLVSLLNTMLVAAMSVVAATLLGLLVGIMRLSVNWLLRNIALVFVEFVRNTPQLVQIIFWYVAILQSLPPPRQSIVLPGGFLLNVRGLGLPDLVLREANGALCAWLAAAVLLATPFVWRLRVKAWRVGPFRVGTFRVGPWALVLPVLAACLLAAGVARIEYPKLTGFNVTGGTQIPPELVALWAGLTVYATAFIAEIVRGSIEAVPAGQHEAARALGLHQAQRTFLVVLPQAIRIMVPQLNSQYLNIIKSTTLGAAVAYPEIFQIFAGTVMNQSGKEVEIIIIVMAVFLSINLVFSAFMNWYNARVALVQR